ncbi:hypothetical protein F2Q69_00054041 [Brassica cretica]|uniref:Uncharacterized protein n=1 Tax=Brassica cretica TaxID=69181 RepID=A0A8S9MUN7_BRACR|nr:hypothetical protein F2Q69_00054041 [Brassica cretica]
MMKLVPLRRRFCEDLVLQRCWYRARRCTGRFGEDKREWDGEESGVSDPIALVRIRESEDGEESGVSDLEDPRRRCSSTVNVTLTPSQSPSQPQMNQAM